MITVEGRRVYSSSKPDRNEKGNQEENSIFQDSGKQHKQCWRTEKTWKSKAGSHCDITISISINVSIRIVSVNRCNISMRKWKNFHFLMLMLMLMLLYVTCVNRSCISISIIISMSAVVLSAEKHEGRVQPRSKNVKKWRLNLKKNWQRLYANIPVVQ